jgi:hypothetical protein
MKNIIRVAIFILVLSLTVGCASRTKPVYNVENQAIEYNLSMEQVEKAIVKSGAQKKWRMMVVKPDQIIGNILVRSHKARIQVDYTEKSYAITYLESDNLLYKDGKIHRNYNRWINYLDQTIQTNLFEASLN